MDSISKCTLITIRRGNIAARHVYTCAVDKQAASQSPGPEYSSQQRQAQQNTGIETCAIS